MNPLTNVKNLTKLNERELELGVAGSKTSWHNQYKDSAWVFVGGLPYDLTEGDVICAFSQYGEIVNINYVRDKATGKPKGFCFICYEDQRSTILSVDNFNGIKLLGRTLKVDHVTNYKPPKVDDDVDELTKALREKGCAPRVSSDEELISVTTKKVKKEKKHKKIKHEKKRKRKHETSSRSDDSESAVVMDGDVGNKEIVQHRHHKTDKEEFTEHRDNTREEYSRILESETTRKRHSDEPADIVSRRLEDPARNSKTKTENPEEYGGRSTSQHPQRAGNSESCRDTRQYDDRPDKQRGRSRREDGDGVRDRKGTAGHTDSNGHNRKSCSSSHHKAERHRGERARRDDSNDRYHKRRY